MNISFLICTYNGAARLPETLRHLAAQRVPAGVAWEVVLVSNASTDDTLATAARLWAELENAVPLRVFSQPKPGKQHALELAYAEARGELLCIVDDDNWLNPDYLQRGYERLRAQPEIGLLGGRNVAAFETSEPVWFKDFQDAYAVGVPLVRDNSSTWAATSGLVTQGVLWGAGLFVRQRIVQQLQELRFKSLFTGRVGEKQFTAGEDDELCYAARLLGYQIWYDNDLVLTHFMTAGRLTEDYLKKLYYSSAAAYSRLSAYQRVLDDKVGIYRQTLPWVKDLLYVTRGVAQAAVSPANLRARATGDLKQLLPFRRQVRTWLNFLTEFAQARANYRHIVDFRERVKAEAAATNDAGTTLLTTHEH